MTENEVSKIVVDAAFKIHTCVGPGLLESAYQAMLVYELQKRGLHVIPELKLPVRYEEIEVKDAYWIDLMVEDILVVEVKSVDEIHPVHKKQLLTYLKFSKRKLGLLINFGAPLIKEGIVRVVNGL